jgi:hypothetical protein
MFSQQAGPPDSVYHTPNSLLASASWSSEACYTNVAKINVSRSFRLPARLQIVKPMDGESYFMFISTFVANTMILLLQVLFALLLHLPASLMPLLRSLLSLLFVFSLLLFSQAR